MKKRFLIKQFVILNAMLFAVLSVLLFSCEKETENETEHCQPAILRDMTGFDGCIWVIQLADSSMLEPINLHHLDIELIDNKSICIRYHERNDMASICMIGDMVEIDFID